jgi:hypothetical protein
LGARRICGVASSHGTRASNTTRHSATTQTHHNSQTAPTCTPARRTHPGARGVGGDLGRRGILRDDLARWGDRSRLQAAARAAGARLLDRTADLLRNQFIGATVHYAQSQAKRRALSARQLDVCVDRALVAGGYLKIVQTDGHRFVRITDKGREALAAAEIQ